MKITFQPADNKSAFVMEDGNDRIGEMIVNEEDGVLSVFHTEVAKEHEGKGLGNQLINAMAAHAREHHLKLKIYCPFVQAVIKKDEEAFKDLIE